MPSVQAGNHSLNYEWFGDEAAGETRGRPVLIFLHEGLGSIRQWRDFPARVAQATGCRALVYDRYGYGQSEILKEKRRDTTFMHDEALRVLPELLDKLRIKSPI